MSEAQSAAASAPVNTSELNSEVVASGGTSPVSWDELEGVTKFKREVKKQEAKEEAEAEKEVKPKKESKSEPKDKDEEEDSKVSVKSDKSKQTDKKELAETKAEARKLKVKNGDQELELATDLKVPVKIDGKLTEVTLQEALNRYSQQAHLDKIYKEYKSQKDSFETERKSISEALNKSYDYLVNKKDMRGFLDYLGEALGVDSHKLYQESMGTAQKQWEEWNQLTPEERRVKELEAESAYYRSKEEQRKLAHTEAKSRQALESQVQSVMQKYSMDQTSVVKAYDDLKAAGVPEEQITPEYLGKYHANVQKLNLIETKLAEINPELAQDHDVIEQLATLAINTNANEREIAEAISQIYGESPEKKLANKIKKSERAARSHVPKNPMKDSMFFDDL